MAWLSDLAGRAENMLNKLDQNTATALGSTQTDADTTVVIVPDVPQSKGIATPGAGISESPLRPSPIVTRKLDSFVVSAIEREIEENSDGLTVEQELAATQILLTEIKAERNELKAEVSQLLNQIHNSANSNKQKALEQEVNELKETNEILADSSRSMSLNQEVHTKRISELELMLSKLNQNNGELQEIISMSKQEALRSVEELNNYRTRAQASLQLKERIIEELRANPDNGSSGDNNNDQISSLLELEQLKHENADLICERDKLILQLESSQSYGSKLEEKLRAMDLETSTRLAKLSDDIVKSEMQRKSLQQENSMFSAEIRAIRTQSNEMNQKLVQQVYDKDQELANMRKRNQSSSSFGGYDDNLDNRIKSLTQSLIQKQTTLEEITAERNALRIQLEKTESQYRSLSQQFRRERQTEDELLQHHMQSTTDEAQLPLFMQDNPFDTQMAKRMKKVIRVSDASLGNILRRYPLLRVVFLIYTVLLHIWVLVVLVSSTPN